MTLYPRFLRSSLNCIWLKYLLCQIDAAINAGNSGGPAFKDGKVVGVAFETLQNAENIGYIIPVRQDFILLSFLYYFGSFIYFPSSFLL